MDTSKLPQLPLSKPSSPDIPLHDIKPLVEIPDYSIYYFSLLIVVGVVLIATLLFFLWRFWSHRNRNNVRKNDFKALQGVDFGDAKAAAYAITRYGYTFRNDGARQREAFENLLARLAPYKYRKTVDPIDEETRGYYNIYVGMIDV